MDAADYRSQSFWHATVPDPFEPRPKLGSDDQVDVAIVGAGYTGLWTAYYLKSLEPGLRVAIVEAEIAGFGASGRNGGWCLGTLAGMATFLEGDASRRAAGIRLQRASFDTVAEVERVCEHEGIDCHWARGGNVTFAMAQAQVDPLREEVDFWHGLGFGEDDVRWLEPGECSQRVGSAQNLGGFFLSHCASVHPARLVRGLAEVVERMGVTIYEQSPARALEPGAVVTDGGRLRADMIVRATEGYSGSLRGCERLLLPLHSMMIATEPLPETVWKEIGLADRETFADLRRMVTYGQRTADDRIAFGARGRYFYGSRVRDVFPAEDPVFVTVKRILDSMFPVLRDHRVTHRWGGALGVPRNWHPSVGLDRATGLGWAGGYVGEGVAASNLAARTLADLLLGRDTELTTLPLVGPPFPPWEPEPLRWLAVTGVRRLGDSLDAAELKGRETPSIRNKFFDAVVNK
ncbi:MAG: FAD-dependent oxidoreductase [Deltaproteobacteria bacterium]|nr:FAD-dependent oxidoreductase [Deltaproteobacteria bacterium]